MATAVHKKESESKYVTCFADSRPDVDITFRDVLLARPTDHYLVGVDNFSMTNTSLGMLEPMTGVNGAFLRIVKRLKPVGGANALLPDATALNNAFTANDRDLTDLYVRPADYNNSNYMLEISSMEVILTVQQLMHRLTQLASDVNALMKSGALAGNAEFEYDGYDPEPNVDVKHLEFDLMTDGRLEIKGTRAFWSCFCIEVPAVQNQFGFFGDRSTDDDLDFTRLRRFLSVNPDTGAQSYAKIQVQPNLLPGNTDAIREHNSRTLKGAAPKIHIVGTAVADATAFNVHDGAGATKPITITTQTSIFSSLERRIALEVGCSLPIKNSPMVDHQKESPDFVLGRWIWRADPRVEVNSQGGTRRYGNTMPACTEYQGAQDRITYHELQPQATIQTLRIKLFARLRTFNEVNETYGMRIIELPTSKTDWWHARLHFMSKDN